MFTQADYTGGTVIDPASGVMYDPTTGGMWPTESGMSPTGETLTPWSDYGGEYSMAPSGEYQDTYSPWFSNIPDYTSYASDYGG